MVLDTLFVSVFKIYYYLSKSGKRPTVDFINSLEPREKIKVDYLLKLLEEYGSQIGMPHTKKIRNTSLWELRVRSKRTIRIFYTAYLQGYFVILHGFIKKTQRTPEKEIGVALQRLREVEN